MGTGFGSKPTGGFGNTRHNSEGFGTTGGFGNSGGGFGNTTGGFGNTRHTSGGFGTTGGNSGGGFGNNTGGIGRPRGGFGCKSAVSGFGNAETGSRGNDSSTSFEEQRLANSSCHREREQTATDDLTAQNGQSSGFPADAWGVGTLCRSSGCGFYKAPNSPFCSQCGRLREDVSKKKE